MTFTLSDAIAHEKEMAECGNGSSDRANEHRQLAIWLEELEEKRKRLKSLKRLKALKIEPLTDKEKRIFLAAMEREKDVCKAVDAEDVIEPYEDSLLSICYAVEQKVKGALWK